MLHMMKANLIYRWIYTMHEQQTSKWSSTPAAVPLNTHLAFAKHHADTTNGLNVHTYHHYCSLHSDLGTPSDLEPGSF